MWFLLVLTMKCPHHHHHHHHHHHDHPNYVVITIIINITFIILAARFTEPSADPAQIPVGLKKLRSYLLSLPLLRSTWRDDNENDDNLKIMKMLTISSLGLILAKVMTIFNFDNLRHVGPLFALLTCKGLQCFPDDFE